MTAQGTTSGAVRLELMGRLELARHASELLHGKEQALQRERVRLEGHAQRAGEQWTESFGQAATWLQRARSLGGSDELADLPRTAASVTIDWQTAMGITYPGDVECVPAHQPGLLSTAAMAAAMDAFHVTLTHAATHAATSAALARLDSELSATRRRRRAITERLIPRLDAELGALELHLDEQDREEALRMHLATGRDERVPGGRPPS